jgi:hypothetical protein
MKLDCVLTACNANPLYMDFIPLFVRAWKKLYPGVNVKIVLVADSVPDEFCDFTENIILFPPIPDVHDAYVSQTIRLLYPGLLSCEGAVLITDMDMLPMNNTYYSAPLTSLANDSFAHFRNGVMHWRGMNQYAMCYNAARPDVWREITGVNNMEQLRSWIVSNYCRGYDGNSDGFGWYSDQVVLYSMLTNWSKKDDKLICLKDGDIGYRRLDRIYNHNMDVIIPLIQTGHFSDYHCFRPYKIHKEFNDMVVTNLPTSMPEKIDTC